MCCNPTLKAQSLTTPKRSEAGRSLPLAMPLQEDCPLRSQNCRCQYSILSPSPSRSRRKEWSSKLDQRAVENWSWTVFTQQRHNSRPANSEIPFTISPAIPSKPQPSTPHKHSTLLLIIPCISRIPDVNFKIIAAIMQKQNVDYNIISNIART